MYHMVKSRLNHLKHISFVTDGVQCHLLMENYIRLVSVARKFIDFYCCLSHLAALVAGNPIFLVLTRTGYLCDFSLCILYSVVVTD